MRDAKDLVEAYREENERLKNALSTVLVPMMMAIDYYKAAGQEVSEDAVVYSFMGGGGSAHVTVADVHRAYEVLTGV